MKTPSDQVARWRSTIADLSAQRERAAKRIVELGEKKAPLPLPAHTGDAKARAKLDEFNGQLLVERQAQEDLGEAIAQAEGELLKADDALRAEQESLRLRDLSTLAERRVSEAKVVDQCVEALARALGVYYATGTGMARVLGSSDQGRGVARKVQSDGRAAAAVAERLTALLPGIITRNPNDPRAGRTLEHLEALQLEGLILAPGAAAKIAGTKAA